MTSLTQKKFSNSFKFFISNNWFSLFFSTFIIFTAIVPLIITFTYIDFSKWTVDSKSVSGLVNTLKFVGIDLLIVTLLIMITLPLLFFLNEKTHTWLSRISLAKSLVMSMGIQMILSGMFYSLRSPLYEPMKNIFGVNNFNLERSSIPLIFQFVWSAIPTTLIMMSSSVSRYLISKNEILDIKSFSDYWKMLKDFMLGHWKVVALILLMSAQGQWGFSPILLFGSPEMAIFNGQETLGLMVYKNITTGNMSEAATGSFIIFLLSLLTLTFISWLNYSMMGEDIKTVTFKNNVSNPKRIVPRSLSVVSFIVVSMLIIFLVFPIILMILMSFQGIDYKNYLSGSWSNWTLNNYNQLLSNEAFHKSMWLSFLLSLIPALIAFFSVTYLIVFVDNNQTTTNKIILNIFMLVSYLPSSTFLFGTYKMISELSLLDNEFVYFVLPRITHISRLIILIKSFNNQNRNASDIYNAMKIPMWRRYKNQLIKNSELLIIILAVSIMNLDSYLYSALGTTSDFTPFVIFLSTNIIDNYGEINTFAQQAAITWMLFMNVLIYTFIKFTPSFYSFFKKLLKGKKWKTKNI